jgi:hypothetical protein
VHQSEIDERQFVNAQVRKAEISREEAQKKKETLDERVSNRILADDSLRVLNSQVHATVRGRPEELLDSMLDFDRNLRKSASYYEEQWSALAQELGGTREASEEKSNKKSDNKKADKWQTIKEHIALAKRREIILTTKQIDRIISEYKDDNVSDPEIEADLKRIKVDA